MRSSNGAWAAFDRDNVRQLVYALPFADFGAMLDPPSEDVTAHAVEMLSRPRRPRGRRRAWRPPIAYLRSAQRPEGSWFGRWGVNHLYGTWCVRQRAGAAAASTTRRGARRVAWMRARAEPRRRLGRDLPLLPRRVVRRGRVEHRVADGVGDADACRPAAAATERRRSRAARATSSSARPAAPGRSREHTGTGFPGDFYINYHLYRHVFPLMALAPYASTDA